MIFESKSVFPRRNKVKHCENKVPIWTKYCNNTSIHGMKYFVENDLSERVIWMVFVSVAMIAVVYASVLLSHKFYSTLLSTVVESTIYPISEVPYPAVTICNYNRFNMDRAEEAMERFVPNASEDVKETLLSVINVFNVFEYGSFDEFEDSLEQPTFSQLNHINMTELYLFMIYKCGDLFTGRCWWRNKYLNCCTIFEKQSSEYGICYSFNSVVNEVGSSRFKEEPSYPWRTSNFGEWSGLRIEINAATSNSVELDRNGVIMILHHPLEWPNNGYYIPSGSSTDVTLKPIYSYTTSNVKGLLPEQRQCIYETEFLDVKSTLPGLMYYRSNCMSGCRQNFMVKFCNCSMEILFPIGQYPSCTMESLKCLFKHNAILNYEKPIILNKYFEDVEEGIMCNCLPGCHRIEFGIEIAAYSIQTANPDYMLIDIHFEHSTLVKYRTDVSFGFLDLMVAFGGIAGLFLGCSILSAVELMYYFFNYLFFKYLKTRLKVTNNEKLRNDKILNNKISTVPIVPEAEKNYKMNKNLKVLRIQYNNEVRNKNSFLY